MIGIRRRWPSRHGRATPWSHALRGAAVAVVLVGATGSPLAARGWQSTVSRSEFNTFARSLDLGARYPGLQGIRWRTPVTKAEAAGFVARNRADGEPGFTIRPPGRRPVYYVTQYSYPRIPSSSSIGADASVAARRRQFLGWATGQFRAADFLTAALESLPSPLTTGVELHDGELTGDDSLVASYPEGFRAAGPDVRTSSFAYGERTFTLRLAPLPGNPIQTERTVPASLVLAVGTGISVLLGVLLWLLAQVGALYHEVGRLARTDALTGVANRRAWDDELPRELTRAARSATPLCVALLDLDHFKDYNDRHGHQAGDRLLKAAAAAWQSRLRKTDLLARYGGEEFAVLLPDCGLDVGMEIAERLRTAQPEGTCSIGVAAWDGHEAAAHLVARADRALYAAKEGGRDRSCAAPAAAPASAAWTPAG